MEIKEINIFENNVFVKKSEWPKDFGGEEFSMTWKLFSPLSFTSFLDVFKCFYDEEKTLLAWKYGFLIQEIPCDVLIRHSDNKSTDLTIRNYRL